MHILATPDALLQEADGGLMLLNATTERYYRLDALGGSLWQQLVVQGDPLETVVGRMATQHHAERDAVRRDLVAFVEQLRLAGFVTVTAGPEPAGGS